MSGATAKGSRGKPWNIPVIFDSNDIVFIFGGGPSLSLLPEKDHFKDNPVIAIHYALLVAPWADIYFMADARCYWELQSQVNNFVGIKISLNIQTEKHPSIEGLSDIKVVNPIKGSGLSKGRRQIFHNGSAGGAAIDLAVKLGAMHIVLLGFDGRVSNKEEFQGSPHTRERIISGWIKEKGYIWRKIMRSTKAKGIELVNATPDSNIPAIPLVKLEDYI